MGRFISSIVVFIVCIVCKAVEPQKMNIDKLSMEIKTYSEISHFLYGSADYITNSDPSECDNIQNHHSIVITGENLIIDDSEKYKITSCTYCSGAVFKDKGTEEVYSINCTKTDDEGFQSQKQITVIRVRDGYRKKTIIHFISYDEKMAPFMVETWTD